VKVELAKWSGYCWGVKRALRLIDRAVRESPGRIYTLGPIIHNPQAVEELRREKGVIPVSDIGSVDRGVLVIRTHGTSPEVLRRAAEKGLDIVDATCPFVKAVQEKARSLVKDGYRLVIVGEKDHPEVSGILAHAGGEALVLESEEDVRGLERIRRAGIVVQTTQELGNFQKMVSALLPKSKELKIYNTICDATIHRQRSAEELAARSDLMIVVGGRNSGNTRRLHSICLRTGTRSYHIESADELDPDWFRDVKAVGVTAGASTPDYVVREVLNRIEEMAGPSGGERE